MIGLGNVTLSLVPDLTVETDNPYYGSRKIPRKINLDWLYKKYRGICWICRKFVPRDQASRDHIKPVSLGGSHKKDNIALAHKECNSKRGNGYREIYFRHFENIENIRDIKLIEHHGLIIQVCQNKRENGFYVLVAKKFKDI